jgi:hypothetical protein
MRERRWAFCGSGSLGFAIAAGLRQIAGDCSDFLGGSDAGTLAFDAADSDETVGVDCWVGW